MSFLVHRKSRFWQIRDPKLRQQWGQLVNSEEFGAVIRVRGCATRRVGVVRHGKARGTLVCDGCDLYWSGTTLIKLISEFSILVSEFSILLRVFYVNDRPKVPKVHFCQDRVEDRIMTKRREDLSRRLSARSGRSIAVYLCIFNSQTRWPHL